MITSQNDFYRGRVPSCFHSYFNTRLKEPKQEETISVTVSDGAAFKDTTRNERYGQQFLMLINRGVFVEIRGWR